MIRITCPGHRKCDSVTRVIVIRDTFHDTFHWYKVSLRKLTSAVSYHQRTQDERLSVCGNIGSFWEILIQSHSTSWTSSSSSHLWEKVDGNTFLWQCSICSIFLYQWSSSYLQAGWLIQTRGAPGAWAGGSWCGEHVSLDLQKPNNIIFWLKTNVQLRRWKDTFEDTWDQAGGVQLLQSDVQQWWSRYWSDLSWPSWR